MGGKRKHILVVEDNKINREIATKVLRLSGFRVTAAANGAEAVQIFEKNPAETFNGILMDIQMPILNGYDATTKIRESNHSDAKEITIVACTSNTFSGDREKAISCGMNLFLEKPIDPQLLRKAFGRN